MSEALIWTAIAAYLLTALVIAVLSLGLPLLKKRRTKAAAAVN